MKRVGGAKIAKTETAQSGPAPATEVFTASEPAIHVGKDLRRSLLITAAILALIGGLALSQSYWG